MHWRKPLAILGLSSTLLVTTIAIIIACSGSPTPPTCPQTIFLSKYTPATFVIPTGGGAFTVPIGILPFVSWDNVTNGCAVPGGASVTFTLTCSPVGGGAPFVLGPQTTTLTTPTVPGAQPPGGLTVPFTVPGGTPASFCTVVGTYDVGFAGGIGAGTLSATGDTQVCLVDPSPDNPDLPLVQLELVSLDLQSVAPIAFHQGDQTLVFIKAINNDLNHTATFDIRSEGVQVAGFPDGITNDEDAYNAGIYRISLTDADVFPAELFTEEDGSPVDRIPGDPLSQDPRLLEHDIVLGPGEVDIFGIAINSFGACADGSCSERNVCADVTLENGGDPILANACVQFSAIVNNTVPPQSPGLTVQDDLKVIDLLDAQWSNVAFRDGAGNGIDATHGQNLLPNQRVVPETGIQITGEALREQFQVPFASTFIDRVTLLVGAASASWQAFYFYQQFGFQRRGNQVTLNGIDQLEGDCAFPSITLNQPQNPANNFAQIIADVSNGCNDNTPVQLFDDGQLVQEGTIGQLRNNPNIFVDDGSCRTLSFPHGNLLDAPLLVADPPMQALNFEDDLEVDSFFDIYFDIESNPADFTATLDGPPGAELITNQGNGELGITFDPSVFTDPLDTREWFVTVTNPAAINSPLVIPIIGRQPLPPQQLLPLPDFSFGLPPLVQVGDPFEIPIQIPPLVPLPPDPFFNMEVIIALLTLDDPILTIADPFLIDPLGDETPADELNRLSGKFGEDTIDACLNDLKCWRLSFGDGFDFETEIFTDGFESGDVSAWSVSAKADNSEQRDREEEVGVLDEDKKLPVFTEEELREAIELFNDDAVFDDKTIGLATDRFGIEVPLPPIRGTYFFDEFESFRKGAADAAITLDGSNCQAPCSGLVFEGRGGGASNIRFENFPNHGIDVRTDSLWLVGNEFASNGAAGMRIAGNGSVIGVTSEGEADGNLFENNGGPGLLMESGDGNLILHNTFSNNGGLGIDLGGDGVTPNDANDDDTGANTLQNFPVLTSARVDGTGTHVEGTYEGRPMSRTHTLQFFASDACDASGNGEGEVLLGTTTITTDAAGMATFALTLTSSVNVGQFVTATATEDEHNRSSEFSACLEVDGGVAAEEQEALPTTYALFQNYPNPFNPQTTIHFDVPRAGPVRLVVFDMLGREVTVLVDEQKAAGRHEVVFSASDLPSGTYLYQLTGDGFRQTRKLVLLK